MSGTALDPRAGEWLTRFWRAARAPALVALVVLLAALVIAVTTERHARGLLDPDAVDGSGSRALAQVLRDQGVAVEVVRHAEQIRDAGPDTTVFVPFPQRATSEQFAALRASAATLVVVAPDDDALADLATGVRSSGAAPVAAREPGCALPAAEAAGSADLGGVLYTPDDQAAPRCYPVNDRDDGSGSGAALVTVADGERTISVIGAPMAFTNEALASEGNAALALRLLGAEPRLLWFLPMPAAAPPAQERHFLDLVPAGWFWAGAQLAVAVLLIAVWRARRLGPVVTEPLPVVVRGAETVEGQGRLYQRSGDRHHAAAALRDAALHRLRPLVGAPANASAQSVVDVLADRLHRPATELGELLYGAAPPDDTELVRLADELDELEREVRRS